MSSRAKLIERILSGRSDRGIPFDELCGLLRHFDFEESAAATTSSGAGTSRSGSICSKTEDRPSPTRSNRSGPSSSATGWEATNHIRYEVIIYWSDEDEAFVAEVPELPGCCAHGDDYESALANAREAIELWIVAAQEFGDPIPEPKGRRLAFA